MRWVQKLNNNQKLLIYPNPFTNELFIEIEFNQPVVVTVQIFDVAFKPVAIIAENEKVDIGKKMWKWESRNNNVPSSIYYISLKSFSGKTFINKCVRVVQD